MAYIFRACGDSRDCTRDMLKCYVKHTTIVGIISISGFAVGHLLQRAFAQLAPISITGTQHNRGHENDVGEMMLRTDIHRRDPFGKLNPFSLYTRFTTFLV